MSNQHPNLLIYCVGIILGFFIGVFIMYMDHVRPNLLLPEKDYVCIDAEPIDKDPSIVACTIILRKGSEPYKEYLKLNPQSTN